MGTSEKYRFSHAPDYIVTGHVESAFADGTVYFSAEKRYPSSDRYYYYDRLSGATNPGPPYRIGGPVGIWSTNDGGLALQNQGKYTNPGGTKRYNGGFLASGVGFASLFSAIQPSVGLTSDLGMPDPAADGPTGWSKYAPGKSLANLGQFIGEFRDVPRMLKTTAQGFADIWRRMGGSRTGFGPKSVANHFLNTQFGWLPFLSDVRSLHNAWQTADEALDRIRRENDKWITRKGSVTNNMDEYQVSQSNVTSHWPLLDGSMLSGTQTGTTDVTKIVTHNSWFSARFRYFIPNINSVHWERNARRLLFGLSPNPSLVWELTPWSWLADWFSNVGDNINNLDNGWASNLVANSAFIMDKREIDYRVTSSLNYWKGPITSTWHISATRKARSIASPFGFHLSESDFTPRQNMILAALGISRYG